MKRKLFFIIALACCLVLAVGILAACNESGGSGQQTPGGENPGTETPGGEDPGTETPGDNPGGEDPGDETVSFTVTFDTQGGSVLADITVENGQVIGEFTFPTKQCSRLVGFALDTAGEQMWNVLTDTVSANITLYAIWEDAHTWGEWADTTPATCTENGERTRECEVCGATESEVIPAAHTWGEWTETIAPGCETEGERSHSCEVCGKTESETIDALGHDYAEEYTVDVDPTCEGVGSESRHCMRCDATTDSRDIAPLGHDYEGAEWHHNNANHWRYCNRCGEESERENHIFDDSGVCECGMIEIAPVSEFRFISLGNNTWRLANYTGNRTNVSIPSTYNNGTVVAISDDAFSGNTAMQTLVIPDTVTSIGARAFSGCVNLTSVTLSKNLTSIGEDAFAGCTQITSATIPAMAAASIDKSVLATLHVTTGDIEDRAFANCTKLVYVTIGDGVKTIGNGAFVNCTGISAISVPDSVTNIGDSAFFGCSGLVEMTLPFVGGSADATTPSASTLFGYIFGSSSFPGAFETVQLYGTGEGESATYYIPRYLTSVTVNGEILFGAFYGCDRIEKITLTSATDLGDYAFYNNTSLTEITIPDGVESIGEMTFAYCTSLEDIDFPQSIKMVDINAMMESAWYGAQLEGIVYIGKALYDYKGIMPGNMIISVPDGIYSISEEAFYGCSRLHSITMTDSVAIIGDRAFYDCSGMLSIIIGSGVNTIGEEAFEGCSSLAKVTMPASAIDYIPQDNLQTVSITRGAIGERAFYNCDSLISLTIGNGVTSIGTEAFRNCSNLKNINWNASYVTNFTSDSNVFRSAGSSGSGITVSFGDSVQRIPAYAFYSSATSYSPNITSVKIGNNVTRIGNYAFSNCTDLASVYINDLGAWCNINFENALANPLCNADALYLNNELVSGDLVIPDGVTYISAYAFYNCKSLTSITISESVTRIGNYAFQNCSNLTSITIPDGVISMGEGTFAGCTNIRRATMPTLAIDYVPQNSLLTVILTSGESIGSRAFENCDSLMSVIIPASVTSIGSNAFYNCTGLTSVTIGNGVTSIGGSAFYGCNKLIEVYNKSSLDITAGSSANGEVARYAKNIYTEEGGSWFTDTADGFRFFYNGTNGYLMGYYGEETAITLPDKFTAYDGTGVTEYAIYDYAFYNCSGLTFVTILDSVTSIGNYAFYGCSGLTSVTFGDGVTSIGNFAFSGCSGLEAVYITDLSTWCGISFGGSSANPLSYAHNLYLNGELVTDLVIPDSVTNIGDYTFYGCTGLTSVTIPASVTSIGGSAFYGCSGLVSVTIPSSVTSIASDAFSGCSGLKAVYITDLSTWCGISFGGSSANPLSYAHNLYLNGELVTDLVIPDSVTNIGDYTFYGCTGLTSVTIPASVTSIGGSAFYGCSGLVSVTIPSSVTSIASGAFSGCSSLENITIPFVGGSAGKTSSDTYQYPFGYIFGASSYTGGTAVRQSYYGGSTSNTTSSTYYIPSSLRNVTVTGGNILYGAFQNCSMLTSVTFGNGVTSIGSWVFSGCTGLTSVTLGSGVTSIGDDAFNGCSGLEAVYISDIAAWCGISFSDSGANPLSYAYNLYLNGELVTDLVIPDSVTSIGDYSFYGCTGLTSITIPDSVTSIGEYAFSGCASLESITIPYVGTTKNGTENTHFGYIFGAVSYSSNADNVPASLKEVIITGGTRIGERAFYYCDGLTSITIPDSVASIGDYTFYGCTGLTSITIPDSVTSIGRYAFNGCTGLTSVTIGDSVTSIGDYAFRNCSGLTSITIPASVTSIEWYAFYGCTGLTSATIGEGVTSIGSYAFERCTSLTSITIPDSVTSIGSSAFSGCSSLENITIPFVGGSAGKTSSDTYQYPFGYIFGTSSYIGGTAVTQHYYGSSTSSPTSTTYYIPSSLHSVTVTGGEILHGAFYNCRILMFITIPNSVTNIGGYTFYGCTGLTSITIPDRVTSIGRYAFNGCTGLTSVTIGDSVTSIGDYAFRNCSGLTSVTIGNGVTSIGDGAFENCYGLTSVTIGNSVTSIGSNAFYGCSGLTSVTIPNSVTSIGSSAFSGCSSLENITIPFVGGSAGKTSSDTYQYPFGYIFGEFSYAGGTAVSQEYYGGNTSNTTYSTYYIPSSLHSVTVTGGEILRGAFYNCDGLTSVAIGDGVTSIGSRAFYNCDGLTSITIGDSVTSIGKRAFSSCSGLEAVYITDLSTWCGISFGGSSADPLANPLFYAHNLYLNGELVTDLVIPGNVTSIGSNAFYGCSGLTSVTIPDSVTSIGGSAFYGCSGLMSVTIGDSVTSIGSSAFSSCIGLTSVTIGDSVTSIGSNAFYSCSGLTSVTIPDSVTSIGSRAFYNCDDLTSVTFENTAGWYRTSSSTATSGTELSSSNLSDPSTAATWLKSTYYSYYWKRNA